MDERHWIRKGGVLQLWDGPYFVAEITREKIRNRKAYKYHWSLAHRVGGTDYSLGAAKKSAETFGKIRLNNYSQEELRGMMRRGRPFEVEFPPYGQTSTCSALYGAARKCGMRFRMVTSNRGSRPYSGVIHVTAIWPKEGSHA